MLKEKLKTMKDLLFKDENSPRMIQAGDLVEGKIIKIGNNAIIIELSPLGTGIIYGGEWKDNKAMIKHLEVGQKISALVLNPENEDGYIELSIKEASLEKTWSDLKAKKQDNETILVKVVDANRGGLVINYSGTTGFLPVSQLSPENYPRVEGGDKSKILSELNKFVGQEIKVKIIGLDKREEKLIVSEKAAQEKKIQANLDNYKKGDVVEGTVSALANFGAFVKIDDALEGLVHISELDWQIIDHPSQILKENEQIKAQIIDISNGQISLSLKSLKKDPWQNVSEKYKHGQKIQGKVIKFTPTGAFVKIEDGIHGLAHSAEFSKNNLQIDKTLKLDESYSFEIVSLSPQMHKMALALAE